jgi:hypothetical protein
MLTVEFERVAVKSRLGGWFLFLFSYQTLKVLNEAK